MKATKTLQRVLFAISVVTSTLLVQGVFVGQAHAVIGRPLTPMSYAGVARRTTRRAVVATTATAPYRAGYPYYW